MLKKTAIVIMANKGMELAYARKLKEDGYNPGVMSRGKEMSEIDQWLGASAVHGSVSSLSDLKTLVNQTQAEFGKIDVVIDNAGHAAKGDLLDLTDENWQKDFDLFANEYSENGLAGGTYFSVSSVIRSAFHSYTRLYCAKYASDDIRMNNVLHGFIDSYETSREIIDSISTERQITAREVAELVSFLSFDAAPYIDGSGTVDL